MGVGVGLIGPLRGPISRSRLGEAGLPEGLRPTPGLPVGLEAGVGAGFTGLLRGAIWGSPAGASASGERTTHRRRWRFRCGWGVTSSELTTGGVCWDRPPNAGLWRGGAGGVRGGLRRARMDGCPGGVALGRAGGRERSSWAAASAERRATTGPTSTGPAPPASAASLPSWVASPAQNLFAETTDGGSFFIGLIFGLSHAPACEEASLDGTPPPLRRERVPTER